MAWTEYVINTVLFSVSTRFVRISICKRKKRLPILVAFLYSHFTNVVNSHHIFFHLFLAFLKVFNRLTWIKKSWQCIVLFYTEGNIILSAMFNLLSRHLCDVFHVLWALKVFFILQYLTNLWRPPSFKTYLVLPVETSLQCVTRLMNRSNIYISNDVSFDKSTSSNSLLVSLFWNSLQIVYKLSWATWGSLWHAFIVWLYYCQCLSYKTRKHIILAKRVTWIFL